MWKRFFKWVIPAFFLLLFLSAARPVGNKPKTVIFLGDSITNRGLRPNGYIEVLRQALTAKGKMGDYKFIGAGHEGNTVLNLQARVDRDVVAHQPDLVFIYIGINDVWKVINNPPTNTPLDQYEAGLKEIIGKIKATGARVVLCTPSVIGEKRDGTNPQDALLDQYAAVSRRVARETGADLCDLRKAFKKYLKKHNRDNVEKNLLTIDRVHLSDEGNKLVARQLLRYF